MLIVALRVDQIRTICDVSTFFMLTYRRSKAACTLANNVFTNMFEDEFANSLWNLFFQEPANQEKVTNQQQTTFHTHSTLSHSVTP